LPELRFVGYGSLMSAEGLGRQLDAVESASIFAIDAPRRFAKPSQRGGCLAMDVTIDQATLSGRVASPDDPPGPCEGLLISVRPDGVRGLVRREGYGPECWDRLHRAAGREGVAAFLLRLAEEADDDVLAYRRALHAVAGPSSFSASHYLPHPVRTGAGAAVVFVAPDPGRTGIPGVDSAKAAYPKLTPRSSADLFDLDDAVYPGFDPARQTWYLELCLRAAAHGVFVGDLIPASLHDAHPVAALLARWRDDPAPLEAERSRLAAAVANYGECFASTLAQALTRSGL
jgi:hypothetical protein